jgi:hypothetical protein
VQERDQVIFDILDDLDQERGPAPPGALVTIAWAEGREKVETLWFPDRASADEYGRKRDDGWKDGFGGDFRQPDQQYGSPALVFDYDGAPPSSRLRSAPRLWAARDCVQEEERGQATFDLLNNDCPERGPVPAGILMKIAWAEGRMQTEVLWFPDLESANQYGREEDDEWRDDVGGDFAHDDWLYGSPVTLCAFAGAGARPDGGMKR